MNFLKKVRRFFYRGQQKMKKASPQKKIVVYTLCLLVLLAALVGLGQINNHFSTTVPKSGGTLTEGVTGIPRFINPVLATTDTDRDLTSLVYAGLLKHNQSGGYTPELAKEYEVSGDNLIYTVTLKDGLTWHDGEAITADDVVFTIQKILDERLISPQSPNWEGVTVTKVGPKTVTFTLDEPYGPFLENLTTGIIPEHIWQGLTAREFLFSKWNTEPIGSGPYQLESIASTENGAPKSYTLKPFTNYTLGTPRISEVNMRFFENKTSIVDALQENEIDSAAGIAPRNAEELPQEDNKIVTSQLLRTFAVFFNQNQKEILADVSLRKALALATDKKAIVDEILRGYGVPLKGPIPTAPESRLDENASSTQEKITEAKNLIESADWTMNTSTGFYEKGEGENRQTLAFTLSTSNTSELRQAAQILKDQWSEIGVDLTIDFRNIDELNQNVIRTREYDALLFGQVVGHNPDLYSFWHSSQRIDPGLNIGLFTSIDADEILEEARGIPDADERAEKYAEFQEVLDEEQPAVFLYTPQFLYVTPTELQGLNLGPIAVSDERFHSIHEWYLETEKIWKIFAPNKKE